MPQYGYYHDRSCSTMRRKKADAIAEPGEFVVTPPTLTPISISDARKQIEYPDSDSSHDVHLLELIQAATGFIQDMTRRQFVTAVYQWTYDQFPPARDPLPLPRSPLISLDEVAYVDQDDVAQTMTLTDLVVSTEQEPPRVALKKEVGWPQALNEPGVVTVTATCGYGTPGDVPAIAKTVIRMYVDTWFNGRSGEVVQNSRLDNLLNHLKQGTQFDQFAPTAGDWPAVGRSYY